MASLDERKIEATFDKLAELGIIRYSESAAIPLTDNGFHVSILYSDIPLLPPSKLYCLM